MQYVWNAEKARENFRKHCVTFEEAATVFLDPLGEIHDDPSHSLGERREILTGRSTRGRLLLVSFTEGAEFVRLISARPANPRERRVYEENTD
ncbi:MAG: uncharacterized protein QOH21_2121 [Acidobacteriota bacterium]|nr:uncharacterized protein [Acidobacteriota bacterium]